MHSNYFYWIYFNFERSPQSISLGLLLLLTILSRNQSAARHSHPCYMAACTSQVGKGVKHCDISLSKKDLL